MDVGRYVPAIWQQLAQIVKQDPTYPVASEYFDCGNVLDDLGQKQEAIASYDKALQIQSDDAGTHYDKACCYGLQKQIDLAIETLKHAISLDSKYREMAKTDSDFEGIRADDRFQALLAEEGVGRDP